MRRALALIALMVLATGAGIAAASSLVGTSPEFEPAPDHLLPGPAELLIGATAEDDWAVRTYVSRTGLLCVERGRLRAGIFGDLDARGRLVPRPPGPTGICGDPDSVVAGVEQLPARGDEPARTFVLGASLRAPSAVTVMPHDGPPVDLPAGPRGAFLGVFPDLREASELPLEVDLADGAQIHFDWVSAPTERRGP